jgi:peptidoglycan-N-acetylglucosamine deacetylase
VGEGSSLTPSGKSPVRWRPGAALKVSAAVHAVVLGTLVARPSWWPQCIAVLAANHFALGLIGMWPRSRSLGANLLRLPHAAAARGEIAITFDDGPDPQVTPRVLDILDRHQAKASFFVIGAKAAANPALIREIVQRGHSVENHSQRHSNVFGFFGYSAMKREIEAVQSVVAAATGRAPEFFRAPMGIRNPMLDPVVARCGLRYVSWTRRGFDTVARNPDAVLARLTRGIAPGDILLLHDRRNRRGEPPVIAVLPRLLETVAAAGLKPVSLPMAMR